MGSMREFSFRGNLFPLMGEGVAFGHQNNSFVQQHGYPGAHGVTRLTTKGLK
jgi:hypothetical protein